MLYHYYSRRFPRDRLNIQGALRHPDEFVNARERERLEMQSRQKSRSYLSSSFCQSPPPPFFFRFYSFLFSLLSGLLCIISFDDLLSFSNALRHGRKRISYSFFCFCFFLLFLYLFTLPEKIRNCGLSIRKYANIVECRRLFRCVGNVASQKKAVHQDTRMTGMPLAFRSRQTN